MRQFHHIGAPSLGFAAIAVAFAALASSGVSANPPSRALHGSIVRANGLAVSRQREAPRPRAVASPCSSNYGGGPAYFVGVPDEENVAGSEGSAVLGGVQNTACDFGSGIGAGEANDIGNKGSAGYSFIGGGYANGISAYYGFIGAGTYNLAGGNQSAVVGGEHNTASATDSFVGAGGSVVNGHSNNIAGADDSFIGAGDLNLISSLGTGSFIGGGGYATAYTGGTTAANEIEAEDAFIGAGDHNLILGSNAFIGSGNGNAVTAVNAAVLGGGANSATAGSAVVAGGYFNMAQGGDSFVGAGGGEFYNAHASTASFANDASGLDSFVGAGDLNSAAGAGSFIGAGGYTQAATGASSGGNTITGNDSFIGSGDLNTVAGLEAFVGSGSVNSIGSSASYASIVGGNKNTVSAEYASVLGGYGNTASGAYAVVAGGNSTTAGGTLSFAAGYHADAANNGSFVWSDYKSGSTTIKDTAANQFVVRASGGTYVYSNEAATSGVSLAPGSGAWANLSDRNAKTGIVPLDDASILAKVATLPVSMWRYRTEGGVRHVGPMAQDFYAAFGVGEDNRHITSIDEDGVALAAIKALHRENARLTSKLATLERDDAARFDALEAKIDQLSRHTGRL